MCIRDRDSSSWSATGDCPLFISFTFSGSTSNTHTVFFRASSTALDLSLIHISRMSDEARRTAQSYESGRIAALAAEQYGFMIRQKKDAGYGEHGKRMFVPSIAVRVSSYIFAYNPRVAAQGKKSPCITVACRGALPFLPGLIIRFPCVSGLQGLS